MQYKITCVTLTSGKGRSSSLLGSITSGLSDALGVTGLVTSVSTALNQITPLVSAVTVLSGGSPAALKILGGVNQAQNVVDGLSLAANGNIAGLSLVANSFQGGTQRMIGNLNTLGYNVNQVPPLTEVHNHLGRMARNLTNPSAG